MKKFKLAGVFLLVIILLINGCFSRPWSHFDLIPNKSSTELRTLKLLIVTDQNYRKKVINFEEEINNIITLSSGALEDQTGIELKIVDFAIWQRDINKNTDIEDAIDRLKTDFPRRKNSDFDIAIGIVFYDSGNTLGCTRADGYIVMNTKELPILSLVHILLHEIGHLFGCNHVNDEKSVMNKKIIIGKFISKSSTLFDKKNIEIIRKNKWRIFPIIK